MAVRYRAEYYDHHNTAYKLELHDAEYTGAVVPFIAASDGCTIKWAGSGTERIQKVLGSELSFDMDMDTAEHLALLDDMVVSAENRFTVGLYKAAVPSVYLLEWAGTVLTDVTRYPDAKKFFFSVRATDGLAALKTVDYDNAGTAYTGFSSIKDIVIRCLNKLNQTPIFWGSTDTFLETSIDWWHTTYTNATNNDPMALTYANNDVFVIRKSRGERTPQNCYAVLETVLLPFGARLLHTGGRWRVEQIDYRSATGGYLRRKYKKDGVYQSALAQTVVNTINQTEAGALLATGMYEYFPALRQVKVLYNTGSRRNLIDGFQFAEDVDHRIKDWYAPIEANGGRTTLRWSGAIHLRIKNLSYTVVPNEALLFIFNLTIRVGDNILLRQYTINNFQIQYDEAEWVDYASNPNTAAQQVLPVFPIPSTGNSANYVLATDYTTPEISVDGEDYTVGFRFGTIKKYDGSSVDPLAFEITYTVDNNWLEVYSYGNPNLNETQEQYLCENNVTGNTLSQEYTVALGDSDNPNALGALRYLDGSTYKRTTLWGEGTNTRDLKIGQLLGKIILSGQAKPIRRLSGTIYGDLDLNYRYLWRSTKWLMLDGSWNCVMNEVSGNWVELRYEPGLSPSPVKKVIIFTDPGNGDGGSFGLQAYPASTKNGPYNSMADQALALPLPTILTGVAANGAASALSVGAVSSVSLTIAVGAGEYIAGDELAIVHPLTGQTEILTVAADSTTGATTLSVTGSLTGNYPAGTYIIKKKKTGYQLNDITRVAVTSCGTSIVVTAAAAVQPRKNEHIRLVIGRLVYTSTEGDFTVSKTSTTFTLASINADCLGLNGYVEYFY